MIFLRKALTVLLLAALGTLCLFTAASCLLPMTEWAHPRRERVLTQPCDFQLRYNEARCLRDGIDPFDVWRGKVEKKPYRPMECPPHDGFTDPVNGYTPWAYILALPLSFLSPSAAWGVYVAFMFACLGVLFWGGYTIGRREGGCGMGLAFATIPLLVVAYPIWSNFNIGNYAVPILAAIFMLCWCLDRGHDIWAGVFWALAMIKPQNALLLAVPLLLRRKFLTCAVAAGLCLSLTAVSSAVCHKSMVAMILQIPQVGSGAFHGCATLPSYLRDLLEVTPALAIAAAIGIALCVWLTVRLRNADSWWCFVLPAVMCSISWTYITSYSFCMAWFLCLAIMMVWAKGERSPMLVVLTVLAAILLPRFYTCWHGAVSAFGGCAVPSAVNYAIDTTVSLAVLLLTVWFCFFITRQPSDLVVAQK